MFIIQQRYDKNLCSVSTQDIFWKQLERRVMVLNNKNLRTEVPMLPWCFHLDMPRNKKLKKQIRGAICFLSADNARNFYHSITWYR